MKEAQGERWVDGGDQAVKGLWLCAVRALRTPQRFQLWSKYGPRGPSPAPGHTNPRPAHIPALFSWLHNASGYLSWWGVLFSFFLYLLIKCVLEELSKCEEPSCRLTFSFIYCWAAPPPAPSTPCLHLQHASIHPSEMKAIWMFLANTQRDTHTQTHAFSLSLPLQRYESHRWADPFSLDQWISKSLSGSLLCPFPKNVSSWESECIKRGSACIRACPCLSTCERNKELFCCLFYGSVSRVVLRMNKHLRKPYF